MLTSLTFPTNSRDLSLTTNDFEGYDYEIMEAPLSEPFHTSRMKMLSRPDGFICMVNWRLTFSPHLKCFIQVPELGYN